MKDVTSNSANNDRQQGRDCASNTPPHGGYPRERARDDLDTEHQCEGLARLAVSGGKAVAVQQAVTFLLNVGSTAALARLLTPTEFGLIAMLRPVLRFAEMFKDAGLSIATIQKAQLTNAQVSTLFWLNAALGILVGAFVAALSPAIVWFYGESRLGPVVLVLAATLPLGALTNQHQALIRRQMRFVSLSAIGVVAMIGGIAVGIVMAMIGASYWSLVAMIITSTMLSSVLVWTVCRWRPGPPVRGCGVRSMLKLGGNAFGDRFVQYWQGNLDHMLLGAIWGSAALGMYSKAIQLLLLPIRRINLPVNGVAVPTLCRLQGQPDRFRRYFRTGLTLTTSLSLPLVVFACVDTHRLIHVLLGDQWTQVVPLFRALGPAALVGVLGNIGAWTLVPAGRTDKGFRTSVYVTLLMIPAFLIGIGWGATGLALAYSAVIVGTRLPFLAYAFHGSPVGFRDLFLAIWRPAFAALLAASVLAATMFTWETVPVPPVIRLVIDGAVFHAVYLIALFALPGGHRIVRETWLIATTARRSEK